METMLIIWLIVIIGFLIIEIFTTTFISICFSLAGIVSLVLYFLGVGLVGQLIGYAVSLALILYFIIPLLRKMTKIKSDGSRPSVKTNLDLIIGEIGVCLERITLIRDGIVKVEGKEWTAKVIDDIVIEAGDPVLIKEIQGSKVIVAKTNKEESGE